MCKISVVMPTYNSSKTIRKTLDGILAQTFTDFEYIIIDGKSTDDTLTIIESYLPSFEAKNIKVHVTTEKDNGVYDAMNKGIDKAKGELIGINNSDDVYEPYALEVMWQQYNSIPPLEKSNVILYGLERQWQGDLVYNVYRRGADFVGHGTLPHSTFFVPKSVYEKYGKFDLSHKVLADYDFYSRCHASGVKLIGLDTVISNYKLGGISSDFFKYYNDFHNIQLKYNFITKSQYKKKKLLLDIKQFFNFFFHWW